MSSKHLLHRKARHSSSWQPHLGHLALVVYWNPHGDFRWSWQSSSTWWAKKMFESSHPGHLFTDHLLHIEIVVVFDLKERKRRNHNEARWGYVVLCFVVVMFMLENDENEVSMELRVMVFDLEKKPKLEWKCGIRFWEKRK